jgi:hypothetical protein
MIDHGQLFQASWAALQVGAEGATAYVDDLNRMRAVLDVAPQGFPWWTAALSGVLLLFWFAGLAAGWIYLNRRARRPPASASAATAPSLTA